jgi:hypothetical protein
MPVRSTPIFIQGNSHPAEETRLMLAGMLKSTTGSFAGGVASADNAHGVVRATDLAVTQNGTPNMTVNVATGGCFIRGTLSANQGAYHLWNDATLNLNISAADITNPRRDLIVAQVRDSNYSGADRDARIIVVTGTPAASPVDPSLAALPNALVLARVAVAAGASSIVTANITDLRTVANVAGTIPTFNTSALATTAIPSPVDGQAYYLNLNTTDEGPYFFNGTNYRRPWNMPWGVISHLYSVAGAGYSVGETVVATGPSATFIANRRYRWQFMTTYIGQVANDLFQIKLRANNTAGTTYYVQRFHIGGPINQGIAAATAVLSPGNTTFNPVATFERIVGTGGCGTAVEQSMIIEDIGPAGAPV